MVIVQSFLRSNCAKIQTLPYIPNIAVMLQDLDVWYMNIFASQMPDGLCSDVPGPAQSCQAVKAGPS